MSAKKEWVMVRVTRKTHERMQDAIKAIRMKKPSLLNRLAFKPPMSLNELIAQLLDERDRHRERVKKSRRKNSPKEPFPQAEEGDY